MSTVVTLTIELEVDEPFVDADGFPFDTLIAEEVEIALKDIGLVLGFVKVD